MHRDIGAFEFLSGMPEDCKPDEPVLREESIRPKPPYDVALAQRLTNGYCGLCSRSQLAVELLMLDGM